MKAINEQNLKKVKRALQKSKLKRIDLYRMQVGRCDYFNPLMLQAKQQINNNGKSLFVI